MSSSKTTVFFVLLLVACDGNDESAGSTGDVADTSEAGETDATTTGTAPLDTALPFEVSDENRDLRNGVRARVGHVVDGDTVQVWVGSTAPRGYPIRMLGLAAPECHKDYRSTPDGNRLVCTEDDEYYGLKSYEVLKEMVEDTVVTISCEVAPGAWCETDPFDRYLAYLVLDDGKDAAVEMARAGAGFSYTSFFADKRAEICRAEYEARDANRGMWVLGSVDAVLSGMNADTRGWYGNHHDRRCDEAIRQDN